MLTKVKIKNFKSFGKEATLDLKISNFKFLETWSTIDNNQTVDLVFSPQSYDSTVSHDLRELYDSKTIEDVVIIDIKNDVLVSINDPNFSGIPKYVNMILSEDEAEFVAKAKDKGRFDVLVKSEE